MQMIVMILSSLFALSWCQEPANRTVADVCVATRTKSMFCNNNNNCNATGIILCYGNGIGDALTCPESQQFCATSERGDSCSANAPANCGGTPAVSNFRCTSLGYFPNVADCSSYFFCGINEAGDAYEATKVECPSGNVFDPNAGSFCTRQTAFLNNCVQFRCTNSTLLTYSQLIYGANRQFYAFCFPGEDLSNPRVFVCPTNTLPNLTGPSPTCDYRCLRAGAFENTSDRTKFFDCYLNDQLRLVGIERNCPPRSEFNPSRSQCQAIVRALSEDLKGESQESNHEASV